MQRKPCIWTMLERTEVIDRHIRAREEVNVARRGCTSSRPDRRHRRREDSDRVVEVRKSRKGPGENQEVRRMEEASSVVVENQTDRPRRVRGEEGQDRVHREVLHSSRLEGEQVGCYSRGRTEALARRARTLEERQSRSRSKAEDRSQCSECLGNRDQVVVHHVDRPDSGRRRKEENREEGKGHGHRNARCRGRDHDHNQVVHDPVDQNEDQRKEEVLCGHGNRRVPDD